MLLQIFKAILFTSMIGSVLTVILLLLKPITKRCFGSTWQYYAWAIVLVVMMLPITIPLPQSSTPVAQISQTIQPPATETAIQQERQPLQNAPVQTTNHMPFYNTVHTAKNISLGITDIFSYAWITGCMLFLILTIFRYLVFLRAIRKNSVIISCPELGTNKIITRRTNMIDAPLMVGLFHPTLLLPDYEMTAKSLKFILLHELTHYRRRDLLYKWFSMFVCTVHWFNPLVYIVLKQIDEECEISCDLSVARNLDRQEQKEYMHTILALVTQAGTKQKPLTTALASNKKQIKRRFIMIKTMRKTQKATAIISVITACIILVATVFTSGVLANEFLNDEYGIEVHKNGKRIAFNNKPFIQDEVVYIPLRETLNLFDINNENIIWHKGTITILALPTKTEIYIDSNDCYVNYISIRLIGKVMLKGDTTYVPSDFINVLELSQADLGGNKLFNGLEIFHNDINVIEEYAKSDFSPNDILLVADNLPSDIADAYKEKIFQLYKLNNEYDEYFLYDIENDGILELFVGWKNMLVYTYTDNIVKRLGDVSNDVYKLPGETGIYTYGGFGTGTGGTNYYEIQNGVLASMRGKINLQYTYFGDNVIFRYNDEIISEDEYNRLVENYFNEATIIAPNKQDVSKRLQQLANGGH